MSGTVDQEYTVADVHRAEGDAHHISCDQILVPEVPGNDCGNGGPYEQRQWQVVLVLEPDNRVGLQVAHVDGFALLDALRVAFAHKPADVREEETPLRVVRIGVGVGELVVRPVIPTPLIDRRLKAHCLKEGQQQFELWLGFV